MERACCVAIKERRDLSNVSTGPFSMVCKAAWNEMPGAPRAGHGRARLAYALSQHLSMRP